MTKSTKNKQYAIFYKSLHQAANDSTSVALAQNPTEDKIALIFRQHFSGKLLFAHKLGKWFAWTGNNWKNEETGLAFDLARTLARRNNGQSSARGGSASFATGVVKMVKNDPQFSVTGEKFDTDNYLLNTPGGTYDLRTGVKNDHRAEDYLTKMTAVAPSKRGGKRFLKFLKEVTGGDAQLEYYLKVALGSCLSGAVESNSIMFFTGNGRNGKNTLGDLVMYVMGEYAGMIPTSTLMAKTHESHPTELAALKGLRLAVSSEVNIGDHWNESRINQLTGDTQITGRFMRGDFFCFPRTHKHLIYGNHRPQIRSMTQALKSRILIIPFKQSFAGREDTNLAEMLRLEAGFVLDWLIDGHMEWIRLGRKLPPCEAVENETAEYFSAQSTVEMWIDERCDLVGTDNLPSSKLTQSSLLYTDYHKWKQDRCELPVSMMIWSETMKAKFK